MYDIKNYKWKYHKSIIYKINLKSLPSWEIYKIIKHTIIHYNIELVKFKNCTLVYNNFTMTNKCFLICCSIESFPMKKKMHYLTLNLHFFFLKSNYLFSYYYLWNDGWFYIFSNEIILRKSRRNMTISY